MQEPSEALLMAASASGLRARRPFAGGESSTKDDDDNDDDNDNGESSPDSI